MMMTDMSIFAERLGQLRSQRQLTQARLAELLEVSPRVYNRWERGQASPHLDALIKIADILQVSLDELTGREAVSAEPSIANTTLRKMCGQLDELGDEEQQAVIVLIDSMLKRSKMSKLVAS